MRLRAGAPAPVVLMGMSECVCQETETAPLAQLLAPHGQRLAVREEQSPRFALAPRPGTHSSIRAWRTPRTEEAGGLWSMELQRAGMTE